jgi:hypothetical protein
LGLNLIIDSAVVNQLNVTACDSYSWNNSTYSVSGNYTDTLSTSAGCDSVVTLNLTIDSSTIITLNEVACYSYLWNGTSYTQSGTYYDSLQTVTGCDSVLVLNLIINSAVGNQVNATVCDSYFWNNSTYFASGTYVDTLSTSAGCDSVVTLNLTINNSFSSVDTISSCNNYSWNGNTYSQSGTYVDTLQTILGCDSIASLQLTIFESYEITDSVSSCDTYTFNGVQYSASGVYSDTLTSYLGCDSIITLVLTVNDGTTAPITLELLLDDYCLETYWTVKDSRDTIIYSGQNYNCNAAGGGPQANTLIIENMNLVPNECYTFELGDIYGDGLGASFWGGTDGSWLIKDFNNIIIGQGQGNFGSLIDYSFYVDQSFVSDNIDDGDLQTGVYIYPNPTKEDVTISINNFNGNIQTEVYDLIGNRLQTTNETTISLQDYARGIYLLKVAYGDRVEEVKVIKQ